jgi:CO/xanthine dehydrogenase FAD-binding subunit
MLYNLREYHCPAQIGEALHLLRRAEPHTVILAGGTRLMGSGDSRIEAVVDLARLGLDMIELVDNTLYIGAMVRLQQIYSELGHVAGGLLSLTAHRMGGWHIRNAATLGGVIASRDIHSPLGIALAALRAGVEVTGIDTLCCWPDLPPGALTGQIITAVTIDLPSETISTAYEQVGRTPADDPIVGAAAAAWAIGGQVSLRVAVGGLLADGLHLIERSLTPGSADLSPADFSAPDVPDSALVANFLGSPDYRRAASAALARRVASSALQPFRVVLA